MRSVRLFGLIFMTDECMKLSEEKRYLFENMSACSASEHDFACVPDSFHSNACNSDFAMSLSSCAGSPEEAPANRDTVKDYNNNARSLELHVSSSTSCTPEVCQLFDGRPLPLWLRVEHEQI